MYATLPYPSRIGTVPSRSTDMRWTRPPRRRNIRALAVQGQVPNLPESVVNPIFGTINRNGIQYGMGAFPNDPYYDPNRPSWLPYQIDTLEESRRKYTYGLKPYPGLPAPQTPEEMTSWTPQDLYERMIEQKEEYRESNPYLVPAIASTYSTAAGAIRMAEEAPWWKIGAGLGMGTLVLLGLAGYVVVKKVL